MALFDHMQQVSAEDVYATVQKYLVRDGRFHVVMVNSFSKWINQHFGCETKYTNQVDGILASMQNDGFEILDVKFNSIMNQGLFGEMEGFHTLISYRFQKPIEQPSAKPTIRAYAPLANSTPAPIPDATEYTHACTSCGKRVTGAFADQRYACPSCGCDSYSAAVDDSHDAANPPARARLEETMPGNWSCSACGEVQDSSRNVCWNCGAAFAEKVPLRNERAD